MNEISEIVGRILNGRTADSWQALIDGGFVGVGVAEESGGSGGSLQEAADILELAAYHCSDIPLAETTWLAAWLLAEAGMPAPTGAATAALGDIRLSDARIDGSAWRVPFAREANEVVVLGDGLVCRVDTTHCCLRFGSNLAGESRDEIVIADAPAVSAATHVTADDLLMRGALARAVQLAGVARRTLDMSVRYIHEREQFGRTIARFQAVQQLIAQLASEVFIMNMSARAAVDALDTAEQYLAVAAAKCNNSNAARTVARIAHQLHGAIGVTYEHELRHATTRLWSWAEEFGNARLWSRRLADFSAGWDPWELITGVDKEALAK